MFKRYLLPLLAIGVLGISSASAVAAEDNHPGWRLTSRAADPAHLIPGGIGYIQIDLYNVGAAPSSGPITVTDMLPPGTRYTGVQPQHAAEVNSSPEPWECAGATLVKCISSESIAGDRPSPIDLRVEIEPGASGSFSNHVTASGGGALTSTSATNEVILSAVPAGFGFTGLEAWASNADGTTDLRAGSHPYEFTLAWDLNAHQGLEELIPISAEEFVYPAGGEVRNLTVNLPPGLIGDPNAVPQCTQRQFDLESCPAATQIGTNTTIYGGGIFIGFSVFNMVPPPGMPAQFAFSFLGIKTYLDASVRSGGDYGLTEHVENVVQREIVSSSTTIWGVPSDPSHNPERCSGVEGNAACGLSSSAEQTAFLTLPTACGAPQKFGIEASTWQDESVTGERESTFADASGTPAGFTGCSHLDMSPTVSVAPDTTQADTPAGLTVDVKVLQEGLLDPEGTAPADIQNTVVTLPEGLVINPGQAAGLAACQASEDGVGTEGPPSCPLASKVGTVAIASPLLTDKLEGNVYVLQSNPPELKLLVAASGDGVNLKLVGNVHLDEVTGKLTTTFSGTPELPFTDFKLAFSGGAQAALATPTRCGAYATNADFTPWSSPFSSDRLYESVFDVADAPVGGGCGSSLPFGPSMIAGATTDQAGGFTSFSLLLSRGDGQQRISSLQFKTPEGLLGMISKVPLCTEPQASQGSCSSESQIGHTVVEAGPGPYPLVVPQPGSPPAPIYLTGGYKGAPYGLSIVVPVVVGPFNLGTVVVRSKIEVDPLTARLTVKTDQLPAILDGVPTDLRTINAVIDRAGFMFNPTNCEPMSFAGSATSSEGTTAPISSHFQVGSCQSLTFKPNFKVSTSGKTSRKNGASLDAKILYPTGALGHNQASRQSNIKSVKVDLPKQLPSRLTTLQKACPAKTFEADPATCPAGSQVGQATAVTPVLPVMLRGPAYFVSYGGAKFPELVVVLQGYGVTVDLHGETFISKAGITSSTFRQVPDVPITSFEIKLPQGANSALAANGNLCISKLTMPTAFVAQNGAVIHQSTQVTATGCPDHKAKNKTKSKPKKKK